ncbi:MAG: hypothetical protein WDM76_01780 [Limisphaerales bacterium]
MPIRINLLAEAQEAEELRRRDPVKRVIVGGALLAALALAWSGLLWIQALQARGGLTSVQLQIDSHTNEYQRVLVNLTKLASANTKLDALKNLSQSRLLQGTLLNALQQSSVDNVQLTRLKVDQGYLRTEGTPSQTNSNGRIILGRPGVATERVVLLLDAKDFSANPGDQVNKFKNAIANQSYFKSALETNGIRFINLSAPQAGFDGKSFVLFTLECHFPDQNR